MLSISSGHIFFHQHVFIMGHFENGRDLGNGQNENILINLYSSYVSDLKSHISEVELHSASEITEESPEFLQTHDHLSYTPRT